jgi:hypothetical protein
MDITKLDYVSHYRNQGLTPIPIHDLVSGVCSCDKGTECDSGGKHPRTKRKTAIDATMPDWERWLKAWPDMNIGILTGKDTEVFATDIDPRHGGEKSLAELIESNSPLPATATATTGGNGTHFLFRIPGGMSISNSASEVAPGIDIRGDGGLIVVEPSVTTGAYKWDKLPTRDDVALPPIWLGIAIQSKNIKSDGITHLPPGLAGFSMPADRSVLEGRRNDFLASAAGWLQSQGVKGDALVMMLNAVNVAKCSPPVGAEEVERVAISISKYNTPPPANSNGWPIPQPLPSALKPVPALEPAILPVTLRSWAVDTAERLQCPIEYLVMPALVGAGAIIGNRVGISPKRNDSSWVVYPALWGGVVGPPGSMKTPSMNASLHPIQHLEEQAGQTFKLAYAAYETQKQAYDLQISQMRSAAKKGNMGSLPLPPTKPVHKRHVVHDVTYQKLGEILAENPNGVLALADELSGLLQSLDAPGQEAARGFFLAGWGGTSSYSFDRIGRGSIVLPRFCLSVFGGFQPDRIKGYVRGAMSGRSTNDGLLQRFQLLVWPDMSPDWKFVDRAPDHAALQAMLASVLALADGANRKPPAYRFTDVAQLKFDQWYEANERWLRRGHMDASRQSHFAKYRSLIPGLALLFHLLDGHEGHVCDECINRALEMAMFLRKHAERIYASVTRNDGSGTRALAQHLIATKLPDGFTARSLVHKGWAELSNSEAVHEAINNLIDFGWLKAVEQKTGGRPSTVYFLNPRASSDLL